jgi:drug/metabolite transporter (DMT)-like permease
MLGFILALGGSFFGEVSDSIGKRQMGERKASVYTIGFLSLIFAIIFLTITALTRGDFHFSLGSLPTFIPRVILEIVLNFISLTALARADRSIYGFVRTLTIPLLLIADFLIGYSVSYYQIIGIAIIVFLVAFASVSKKIEKKGVWLVLVSAILPVATLSLYKYDISHFNSVEAEQIILMVILLVFFFVMALTKAKENPLVFLTRPIFFLQAAMSGLSSIGSFAFLFAPPSVVIATLRGSAVLFSTLSGDFYFREKKPLLKLLLALGIIAGLLFLV